MKHRNDFGLGESTTDDIYFIDPDRLVLKIGKGTIAKKVDKPSILRKESPARKVYALPSHHTGLCPCGCGHEVPNNCYYATKQCGRRWRSGRRRNDQTSSPVFTGRTKTEYKPKG